MVAISIASPVRQTPGVLREFLRGLARLERGALELAWFFVDDNDDPRSSALLSEFASSRHAEILPAPPRAEEYVRDSITHRWNRRLTERVASHKDRMLARAVELGSDAVFLVDSDLVVHPDTIEVLQAAGTDIISEVFWTKWTPDAPELPNVWVRDNYTLFERAREEVVDDAEELRRTNEFVGRLRLPGVHRVGGLGACTLVSRRALEAGVRFELLPNLSWAGEDRHFCLRAAALGFGLRADTHVPPLHLYRPSDIADVPAFWGEVDEYRRQWFILQNVRRATNRECDPAAMVDAVAHASAEALELRPRANVIAPVDAVADAPGLLDVEVDLEDAGGSLRGRVITRVQLDLGFSGFVSPPRPRIGLSMIVRDEADRYLRRVIERLLPLIDCAVIVDDASVDASAELCEALLGDVPHHVLRLDASRFEHEHEIRAWQWRAAVGLGAEWILGLDADELMEERAIAELPQLIAECQRDVIAMRLFDMWDPEHFRDDELWQAHTRHWPVLVRATREPVRWRGADQHCGRWPLHIETVPWATTELRVQHLGWMRATDRLAKYHRYLKLDPDAQNLASRQYASILDGAPRLTAWRV